MDLEGVAWVVGKIGNGLELDGVDDYVLLPNSIFNSPTQPRSFTVWVKPAAIGSKGYVVALRSASDGDVALSVRDDGRVRFRVAENSGTAAFSSTVLSAGSWYHLAGTWDGSRLAVYVDGVEEASNTQSGEPGNGNGIRLGNNPDVDGSHFNGVMDDVRFYDRELSPTEVQSIYSAGS